MNELDQHVTEYDATDWESDDSDVLESGMHFESDPVHLDYQFQSVDLDLHVEDDGEVFLVATEDNIDEWRSTSLSLEPDAAEQLAEQLLLAARYARENERADIRL
jgi:hypothetical protein